MDRDEIRDIIEGIIAWAGLIAVCWWGDWVGRPMGTSSERTYFLSRKDYQDTANLMYRLLRGIC